MLKMAFFVEGYTEVLFLTRLVTEIGGSNNVLVEHREIKGGSKVKRTLSTIKAAKPATGQKFFFLVVDCGGDSQVKTRILEEHQNLTREGYTQIIGLRDLRPEFAFADLAKVEMGLRKYVKTSLIPVEFILSIMEIEAWFLAEHSHFQRISSNITASAIKCLLGFDPAVDDCSQRPTPMNDLNLIYNIANKSYVKGSPATIDALDFSLVYLDLPNRITYLKRLCDSIERFVV